MTFGACLVRLTPSEWNRDLDDSSTGDRARSEVSAPPGRLGCGVLAALLINVVNTILNVALPTLVRDLRETSSELQWIVDSYALVFAGLLFVGGSLPADSDADDSFWLRSPSSESRAARRHHHRAPSRPRRLDPAAAAERRRDPRSGRAPAPTGCDVTVRLRRDVVVGRSVAVRRVWRVRKSLRHRPVWRCPAQGQPPPTMTAASGRPGGFRWGMSRGAAPGSSSRSVRPCSWRAGHSPRHPPVRRPGRLGRGAACRLSPAA